MNPIARGLISAGVFLIILGLFWQFGSRLLPLGKLPGDIYVERPGYRFYFPVVTSLLVSVLLSLILYLFRSSGK